jgi:hypothetical protein
MLKQLIFSCFAFIVLATATPCSIAAEKKLEVDHVELYGSDAGGRIFLKGDAGGNPNNLDTFAIKLVFETKQWKSVPPVPANLGIQDEENIADWNWKVQFERDANVDSALRKVTFKGTLHPKNPGTLKFSYQMPSGGWDVQYKIILPDPTTAVANASLDITGALTLRNASGLDWPKNTHIKFFAQPGLPTEQKIDLFTNTDLADEVKKSNDYSFQLQGTAVATYELVIPATDSSNPFKTGNLHPNIALTFAQNFPQGGVPAKVSFIEGSNSTDAPGKITTDPFTVGPSTSTIAVKRSDSKEAVGLVKGSLFYRNASQIDFSSLLKADVTMKGVCELACCDHVPKQTLKAGSKLTVKFKSVPLQPVSLDAINNTLMQAVIQQSVQDILDLVTSVTTAPVSECQRDGLEGHLATTKDELIFLLASVKAMNALEKSLRLAEASSAAGIQLSPNNLLLKKRNEEERKEIMELVASRNKLVERYAKRVLRYFHPVSSCCDLAPLP